MFYNWIMTWNKIMRFLISTTQCTNSRVDTDGTDGCRQSLDIDDIDDWIWVGMPFENGVADVTRCSHIGVVPFSTRRWRPKGSKILSWTRSSHGFPHGILWIMLHGLPKFASDPSSKGRPNTNSCKPYKSQGPYTTSMVFERESMALTIMWSQPFVPAWSDPKGLKGFPGHMVQVQAWDSNEAKA